MGPAARQSRRTIPFFLELTSVHRSGEEVDESRGRWGDPTGTVEAQKLASPCHPSNKSLVCGPSSQGQRAGTGAEIGQECSLIVHGRLGGSSGSPVRHPATPEALWKTTSDRPLSLQGLVKARGGGSAGSPWGS